MTTPLPVPLTERLYAECNKLDGRNFAKKVVALMLEAADELRERDTAIGELRRERIEDSEVLGRSMRRVAEQAQALETLRGKIKELEARVDSETPIRCLFCKRVPPPPAVCNDEVTQSICFECLERVVGQLRTSKAAQDRSVTGAAKQWSFVASSVEPDAIRTWQELQFPAVSGSTAAPSVTSGGAVENPEAQGGQPAPERCSTCGFSSTLHAEAAQEIERLKAEKEAETREPYHGPCRCGHALHEHSGMGLSENIIVSGSCKKIGCGCCQFSAARPLDARHGDVTHDTLRKRLRDCAHELNHHEQPTTKMDCIHAMQDAERALTARHEPLTALIEGLRDLFADYDLDACDHDTLLFLASAVKSDLAALLAPLPSGQTEKAEERVANGQSE